MSDARARDLERSEPDDRQARVALLATRLRSGALPRWRLELAAAVGDEAARLTLGPDAPPAFDWVRPLDTFARFEQAVLLRGLALAVELAYSGRDAWTTEVQAWVHGALDDPALELPRALVGLLSDEEWACPLSELADAARLPWPPGPAVELLRDTPAACGEAARQLAEVGADVRLQRLGDSEARLALVASGRRVISVIKVLRSLWGLSLVEAKGLADRADAASRERLDRRASYTGALRRAEHDRGRRRLRPALLEALRGWALRSER